MMAERARIIPNMMARFRIRRRLTADGSADSGLSGRGACIWDTTSVVAGVPGIVSGGVFRGAGDWTVGETSGGSWELYGALGADAGDWRDPDSPFPPPLPPGLPPPPPDDEIIFERVR